MPDEISKQLLSVEEIGIRAYERFRKERFVEKSASLHSTIHRTNIKTFMTLKNKNKDEKSRVASKKRENIEMRHAIEVACARNKTMEDLLQYDLTSSTYLFDKEDFMTKPQKSAIVQELESQLEKTDERAPKKTSTLQTACIVDVMANVRKIRTKDIHTFGQFSKEFLQYVSNVSQSQSPHRKDFVFDSYAEGSIKDSERRRRQEKAPIEMNQILNDTPLPVNMEQFWPSNGNKVKLQKLLHSVALAERIQSPSEMYVVASAFSGALESVTCKAVVNGCPDEISNLCCDLEEVDFKIIPHIMHAIKTGTKRIIVLSADTDVFVLSMHYWEAFQSEGLQEIWIRAGVGNSTRYIPVHTLASKVGQDLCHLLPLVHTLTGCDYTSKVGTKPAALKVDLMKYFRDLDFGSSCPADFIASCEAYLVQLLKKKTTFTTMDQLRNYTYHHSKGVDVEQLPPTSHAIQLHIRRAYFATYQMMALLNPPNWPTTLDTTDFGFKKVDDLVLPIKGLRHIPEEYTNCCNCKKCSNDKCVCRKGGLPCIQFCKCKTLEVNQQVEDCKNPYD